MAGRQVQPVLEEAGVCCRAGGFGNFSPPPSVSFFHPTSQKTHLKAPPSLHINAHPPWPPKQWGWLWWHQHPILKVSTGEGAPARPVLVQAQCQTHSYLYISLSRMSCVVSYYLWERITHPSDPGSWGDCSRTGLLLHHKMCVNFNLESEKSLSFVGLIISVSKVYDILNYSLLHMEAAGIRRWCNTQIRSCHSAALIGFLNEVFCCSDIFLIIMIS